jgi:hypothetical protein
MSLLKKHGPNNMCRLSGNFGPFKTTVKVSLFEHVAGYVVVVEDGILLI